MKNNIKKLISVLPDVVKLLSGQLVTFIFHGSSWYSTALNRNLQLDYLTI